MRPSAPYSNANSSSRVVFTTSILNLFNSDKIFLKYSADIDKIKVAHSEALGKKKYRVLVCGGAGCVSSDCAVIQQAVRGALEEASLAGDTAVIETGCMGTCAVGPVMLLQPDGVFYTKLTKESARKIIRAIWGRERCWRSTPSTTTDRTAMCPISLLHQELGG